MKLKAFLQKGHKSLFLTDIFRRRTLGLAVRKIAKPQRHQNHASESLGFPQLLQLSPYIHVFAGPSFVPLGLSRLDSSFTVACWSLYLVCQQICQLFLFGCFWRGNFIYY